MIYSREKPKVEKTQKEKLLSFFNFVQGHFASDKETLLTRLATEGFGLHRILMFFCIFRLLGAVIVI